MTKEKVTWLAIGLVVGVVFASQIRRIPGVDKIPTV
jgi:hypothetical protein